MDYLVDLLQLVLIVEDNICQCRTIQFTVVANDLVAKVGNDFVVHWHTGDL